MMQAARQPCRHLKQANWQAVRHAGWEGVRYAGKSGWRGPSSANQQRRRRQHSGIVSNFRPVTSATRFPLLGIATGRPDGNSNDASACG